MGAARRPHPRPWSNHARCPRLPMFKRAAIHAKGMVVFERNSRANWTFPHSPLRRALRSASLQPIRFRPSTTRRSACAASAYCTASPKWLEPGRASTCSSSSWRNSSPPRHQPLSTRLNSPRRILPPPPLHSLLKHPSPRRAVLRYAPLPEQRLSIVAQQPLHPHHQIGLGRFEDQVKVVAHQAIRMHLPAGLLTGLRQRLQQSLSVLVILEDGLPLVTPIHHMIDCPRILNAHLPSHAPRLL